MFIFLLLTEVSYVYLSLFVFGCKDPIDADTVKISEDANVNAPTDLNGLTSYLFQEWDNDESRCCWQRGSKTLKS